MLSMDRLRKYRATNNERTLTDYATIDIRELNELVDSHIKAVKELRRLRTQNEAMLVTIKMADEIIVKAVKILMPKWRK